ncbi:hypothetical protein [Sorangium sp. So ce887]|uniref:hypothetical protein n=1 Tax=Sorangium sp. So ce887 TaxID=3133324 RepID=UPI003F6228A3
MLKHALMLVVTPLILPHWAGRLQAATVFPLARQSTQQTQLGSPEHASYSSQHDVFAHFAHSPSPGSASQSGSAEKFGTDI